MNDSGVKEVLLDKLVGLQDVEAAKRIEEMDTDLISECSEYIIELTGEELPSESVLEQMKQKLLLRLFGRNGKNPRYRKGLLRKILIAAIIVILLVAMSVSMMTLSGGDESLLSRWGYSVLGLKPGERIDFGDSFSIINNGENIEYKSVRQFVRKTGMDVLVPSKMPQGIKVKKVFIYYDSIADCPIVSFVSNDPVNVTVNVRIGKEADDLETRDRTERIGAYDCGLSFFGRQCQCEFNYNGNGYTIVARSEEEITLIVNNLKGSLEK